MNANFDKISKEVYNFEKKAGFDKTSKEKLIKWLKEEISHYKKAKTQSLKSNKIADIIILIMQISRREGISLDKAWINWWKKSKKYLKKKK